MVKRKKQAQICAEGCEEDVITHILNGLNRVRGGKTIFNGVEQGLTGLNRMKGK